MKHNIEDCKIKLRAIWSLAQQIKVGVKNDDVESHVIVMLTEQIQQDTELLEGEDDSN